jgi:hypothetical protein
MSHGIFPPLVSSCRHLGSSQRILKRDCSLVLAVSQFFLSESSSPTDDAHLPDEALLLCSCACTFAIMIRFPLVLLMINLLSWTYA